MTDQSPDRPAAVHTLVVEPFDCPDGDPAECFTVEHPSSCPDDHYGLPYCGVAVQADNGLETYFRHADDPAPSDPDLPAVTVGRHPIEVWHEKIRTWPAVEYDSGLRLAEVRRG